MLMNKFQVKLTVYAGFFLYPITLQVIMKSMCYITQFPVQNVLAHNSLQFSTNPYL